MFQQFDIQRYRIATCVEQLFSLMSTMEAPSRGKTIVRAGSLGTLGSIMEVLFVVKGNGIDPSVPRFVPIPGPMMEVGLGILNFVSTHPYIPAHEKNWLFILWTLGQPPLLSNPIGKRYPAPIHRSGGCRRGNWVGWGLFQGPPFRGTTGLALPALGRHWGKHLQDRD